MITNICIRNFKTLGNAAFQLGAEPVVLVGPNNCGKTSILQALTMWHVAATAWMEHGSQQNFEAKPGKVRVPMVRFFAASPHRAHNLWHNERFAGGKPENKKAKQFQIDVAGKTGGHLWNIGVEFVTHNHGLMICRPVLNDEGAVESAGDVFARWKKFLPPVEFLPPMSGIAWMEDKLTPASILSRLGEGRTADILRNILFQVLHPEGIFTTSPEQAEHRWREIKKIIFEKFQVRLVKPHLGYRGAVLATYTENGHEYELASGGQGFHQTLLTLALLHLRPGGVFLLDEPDAHLETVRQRDNFSVCRNIAAKNGSQLIIASHSEAVMDAAADDCGLVSVVAGKTRNLNRREKFTHRQLLTTVGWDKVVQAMTKQYFIFPEGSTDIDILAAFAEKIFGAETSEKIRMANTMPVANKVTEAVKLFHILRHAVPELRGYGLFDGDAAEKVEEEDANQLQCGLRLECWQRREIENYLLLPDVLHRHACAMDAAQRQAESENSEPELPLPSPSLEKTNAELMREAYESVVPPIMRRDREHPHWRDNKMSTLIVDIMEEFSKLRGGAGAWSKWKCHTLVQYMEPHEIPDEVREKILAVLKVIDPEYNPEEKQ